MPGTNPCIEKRSNESFGERAWPPRSAARPRRLTETVVFPLASEHLASTWRALWSSGGQYGIGRFRKTAWYRQSRQLFAAWQPPAPGTTCGAGCKTSSRHAFVHYLRSPTETSYFITPAATHSKSRCRNRQRFWASHAARDTNFLMYEWPSLEQVVLPLANDLLLTQFCSDMATPTRNDEKSALLRGRPGDGP